MPAPYRYLRCGDARSPGVMERRNGSLGLRDDDDDFVRRFFVVRPPGLLSIPDFNFLQYFSFVGNGGRPIAPPVNRPSPLGFGATNV